MAHNTELFRVLPALTVSIQTPNVDTASILQRDAMSIPTSHINEEIGLASYFNFLRLCNKPLIFTSPSVVESKLAIKILSPSED